MVRTRQKAARRTCATRRLRPDRLVTSRTTEPPLARAAVFVWAARESKLSPSPFRLGANRSPSTVFRRGGRCRQRGGETPRIGSPSHVFTVKRCRLRAGEDRPEPGRSGLAFVPPLSVRREASWFHPGAVLQARVSMRPGDFPTGFLVSLPKRQTLVPDSMKNRSSCRPWTFAAPPIVPRS